MLRCPPSRITLTASDIADFENRCAGRHSARLKNGKTAKVRLSPGPAHSTRLSLVPAEHNVGRQRAASSSSEATVHTDDKATAENSNSPLSIDPIHFEETEPCQIDTALARLLPQRPSVLATIPRRQVDSFYGTEQALDLRTSKNGPVRDVPSMDGTVGLQPSTPSRQANCIPWTPRGNEVLAEIISDAYPSTRQPQWEHRLLASARARRRNARSDDTGILQEPDEVQDLIFRSHNDEPVSRHHTTTAFAVPELVLPREESIAADRAALDPGAPIFMPRTRFGTAGSSGDTSNLTVARDIPDLRMRSSSEQNANVPGRSHHPRRSQNEHELRPSASERPGPGRSRRRSRTADQNIALPRVTLVSDRYPFIRPESTPNDWQYDDSNRRSSRQDPDGPLYRDSHVHIQNESTRRNGDAAEIEHSRSITPAYSANSRSTPNLLQLPSSAPQLGVRGSSLPWTRIDSRHTSYGSVPSMVSAASGISGEHQASRQSSREALNAVAEFLRMRNSPLDDLTEQLSRTSTSRPRSVGRSWTRPPRRVSLLAGDLFRPEPPPAAASSSPITAMLLTTPEILPSTSEEPDSFLEDVVALALALPRSSPVRSSSIALPSTPSLHSIEPRSLQSSRGNATAKSPERESAIKRKPVPAPSATPKVPIYDDSKPPHTQPQTPADVRPSRRRPKTRSDTTIEQPPIYFGTTLASSPPTDPERHPYRNTYPSTVAAQPTISNSISTASMVVQDITQQNRTSRRTQTHLSSEQAENVLEGHIQGLEEDRQVWLSRREGGDLDVTPPREGRFERYLF